MFKSEKSNSTIRESLILNKLTVSGIVSKGLVSCNIFLSYVLKLEEEKVLKLDVVKLSDVVISKGEKPLTVCLIKLFLCMIFFIL